MRTLGGSTFAGAGKRMVGGWWPGVLGANVPSAGDHGASPYYNDGIAADKYYRSLNASISPGAAIWWYPDGSATITPSADGSYSVVYQLFENNTSQGTATITATSGTLSSTADASITLDDMSLSADAAIATPGAINADASVTLDDVSASGAGTLNVQGSASVMLDDVTAIGAGAVGVQGAAATALDDVSLTAAGSLFAPASVTADAGIALGDVSLSAAGSTLGDLAGLTLPEQLQAVLAPVAQGGAWYAEAAADVDKSSPYIVWQLVVSTTNNNLSGPSDLQNTRVQIDVWAPRFADAYALGKSVAQAMQAAPFTAIQISTQPVYDDVVKLHRNILDFSCWSTN